MKLAIQLTDPKDPGLLRDLILKLRAVIDNGRLGFGDGITVDNIFGAWTTYTTNVTPNTEDTINHNLGVVPVGFIVVSLDKAAVVYKGTTAWTATQMFLKCNTASTAVVIFVLGPSNRG